MRTKTLLLSAAVGAVGLLASNAQVYSVNSVGYVNLAIPTGFSMIANPLNTSDNTVGSLLNPATSGLPDGTTLYKFNPANGQYQVNVLDFGEWALPAMTLNPGEGAFIQHGGAPTSVTFVGEVAQGALTQNIPQGFSIQASQVPQSGQLDTVLGFPAVDGDTVFMFVNATGQYSVHVFDFGDWSIPPVPRVGESFFVQKAAATVWTRTFSVNN
jgi:hypothetical protein